MAQSVGKGRVVGGYLVGRQLGYGSYSFVWHARHKVHGTEVAIKEINMVRLSKKLQENLKDEVGILRKINHPNIIRLLEIIEVRIGVLLASNSCLTAKCGVVCFGMTKFSGSFSEETILRCLNQH